MKKFKFSVKSSKFKASCGTAQSLYSTVRFGCFLKRVFIFQPNQTAKIFIHFHIEAIEGIILSFCFHSRAKHQLLPFPRSPFYMQKNLLLDATLICIDTFVLLIGFIYIFACDTVYFIRWRMGKHRREWINEWAEGDAHVDAMTVIYSERVTFLAIVKNNDELIAPRVLIGIESWF